MSEEIKETGMFCRYFNCVGLICMALKSSGRTREYLPELGEYQRRRSSQMSNNASLD